MSIAQSLLPEFDREMANTRKTLERVPDDKFGWKPHDKSGSMGWLAAHLANIPGWATFTVTTDFLDMAPNGVKMEPPPSPKNRKELLALFIRTWPRGTLRWRVRATIICINPGRS
jgi:hypothetical protein